MRSLAEQRREQAAQEIGRTLIQRPAACILLGLFLLTVMGLPLGDTLLHLMSRDESPQSLRVFDLLPRWEEIRRVSGPGDLLALLPGVGEIRTYEDALEDASALSNWLLPRVQWLLTRGLGVGNEQAYLGRDGWLFYRADVDYVTGPGFLDPERLTARKLGGNTWEPPPQPDPLAAILEFHEQLQARGIALVLMPTPVKPVIHPERFSSRFARFEDPPQNPSYSEFVARVEAAGIPLFDPTSLLEAEAQRTGRGQYLRTDTHWTPEAMERVATRLADFLRKRFELQGAGTILYRRTPQEVKNLGDIAAMLKLSPGGSPFAPEEVTVHIVQEATGEPWRSSQDAEILLLGDSFSNIYSLEAMGWGTSAGLAEHLSAALGEPVDRIVINAGGSYATRQALVQALGRGEDRLAGKRVVVYQFAVRELFSGDWKRFALPQPDEEESEASAMTARVEQDGIRIRGILKERSDPPTPGSVPYPDCVIALHIVNVEAEGEMTFPEEILVFTWGMRDNRWMEVTSVRPGDAIAFRVRPWEAVEQEFGSYQRIELDSEDAWFLDTYWGEESP